MAGIRNTVPLTDLADLDPASYEGLLEVMATLERHYRDLCDIEFTIEDGRLWVLQTRVGKRTPQAAFRIAADLVREGVIDVDQALSRVTGNHWPASCSPASILAPNGSSSPEVSTPRLAQPWAGWSSTPRPPRPG